MKSKEYLYYFYYKPDIMIQFIKSKDKAYSIAKNYLSFELLMKYINIDKLYEFIFTSICNTPFQITNYKLVWNIIKFDPNDKEFYLSSIIQCYSYKIEINNNLTSKDKLILLYCIQNINNKNLFNMFSGIINMCKLISDKTLLNKALDEIKKYNISLDLLNIKN